VKEVITIGHSNKRLSFRSVYRFKNPKGGWTGKSDMQRRCGPLMRVAIGKYCSSERREKWISPFPMSSR
jgi:hypothetical protein